MTDTKLAWGIIGTGSIAGVFAQGITESRTGRLVAVGSRAQETADAFGKKWQIPHRHGSYDALLADPEVEAVYISTPHPLHAEWTIKAAEAGKHILCEKPFSMNTAEAQAMIEAARRHNVFLMEAFMYRGHPQIAKVIELLQQGTIGTLRLIQADFSFHAEYQPDSRLFAKTLGGGGILDVGGYCVSLARLLAGIAVGKPFAEPEELTAVGQIGKESQTDEYTIASLKFPGGILAQLACGVQVELEHSVRLFGSKGSLVLSEPWTPPAHSNTEILVKPTGEKSQKIVVDFPGNLYGNEVDQVAVHLAARQAPLMTWEDTLGNMRTLDRWRAAIGLTYPADQRA